MLDHIAPTVFWPVFVILWLVVSFFVTHWIGKIIHWVNSNNPRNHYVDRVDVPRCERTGSQGENQRRINTWSGR